MNTKETCLCRERQQKIFLAVAESFSPQNIQNYLELFRQTDFKLDIEAALHFEDLTY